MTQTAPPADRPHAAAKRYIYAWGGGHAEGDATMRDLLGGKGAGLAEMTNAGLPVPPGFTITTEACNDYFTAGEQLPAGLWDDVLAAVREVEGLTGKGFGNAADPLLVSVRSGAKFSMPGMMDTVLNLGLNEETLHGMVALTGNERFGWDAYRRFIQMFGRIVMEVKPERFDEALEAKKHARGVGQDTELTADDLRELVDEFKAIVRADTGRDFPSDPYEQLDLAIKAVFASWFGKRAMDYRNNQHIAHDLGHRGQRRDHGLRQHGRRLGHRGRLHARPEHRREDRSTASTSPTPRARTSSPASGPRRRSPRCRPTCPRSTASSSGSASSSSATTATSRTSSSRSSAASCTCSRRARRSGPPRRPCGSPRTSSTRASSPRKRRSAGSSRPTSTSSCATSSTRRPGPRPRAWPRGSTRRPARPSARRCSTRTPRSSGSANGERVVLVRIETSPDDFHGMAVAQGILTARGGATSHAAVVARQIGKPCVAGCHELHIDYAAGTAEANGVRFAQGDWISVDGSTGEVFLGPLPTVSARFEDQPELQTILGWADEVRRMEVWTNADKPEEAAMARRYGAQGIGLCRTEHMFREGERLEIVRGAILVANAATRAKARRAAGATLTADETETVATFDAAMAKLEVLQQGDFEGIFRAMDGLPVVIRLIDPPLHEFLPNLEDQLVKVTRAEATGGASEEDKELLATIKSLHEQNPMLGLRGCRLGLMIPDFVKVQTRAILNALIAVQASGGHPKAKIMIPLVGHVNELKATRDILEAEAKAVESEAGLEVEYVFGTMIEVPRGALTADEIARHASFFSFGTNDLTQMTFGYSRDDAEGGFLLKYVEDGILPVNPFQTLDDAVAGLMKTAVDKGRATRPDLELGICGEHGGDPESIHKCEQIGLDYVSCSPFRVPVARLAAAQAVLASAERDK